MVKNTDAIPERKKDMSRIRRILLLHSEIM